jgi:hypothetical protein
MRLVETIFAVVLLLLGGAGRSGSAAIDPDEDRALKIKAGMLLNFVRYTDWPPERFATAEGSLIVTVVGTGGFDMYIEATLNNQRVRDRRVEVRRLRVPQPAAGEGQISEGARAEFAGQITASHVVCICESEKDRVESILKDLGTSDTLTVSDIKDFAERGGMLGLTIRNAKIAFDANQRVIERTRLKVSSQLMRVARVVESKGGGGGK